MLPVTSNTHVGRSPPVIACAKTTQHHDQPRALCRRLTSSTRHRARKGRAHGDGLDGLLHWVARRDADRVLHVDLLLQEIEPRLHDIDRDDLPAVSQHELRGGHPDGPRPDDQHELVLHHSSAVDGMAADAQRLDQSDGWLAAGHLLDVDRVELVRGDVEGLAQAAVDVDAHHADVHAAVRLALLARDAAAAVQVRLNGADVAGLDVLRVERALRNLLHRDAELVPDAPRVLEERLPPAHAERSGKAAAERGGGEKKSGADLLSVESVEVRAADADGVGLDLGQGAARQRQVRRRLIRTVHGLPRAVRARLVALASDQQHLQHGQRVRRSSLTLAVKGAERTRRAASWRVYVERRWGKPF